MERDSFATKLGILAASAGSAVGLGNIWKFPYVTGENGGAAFILIYLICILIFGLPIMISEFALGRKAKANTVESYKKLAPDTHWHITGYLSTITAFIILSYYLIIAGWILSYIVRAASGKLISVPANELEAYFGSVCGGVFGPLFWNVVVVLLTSFVVFKGIEDGVEKYSKILMPSLFVLLIILMIRSLTLPGAKAGVDFLFKPDFSKLNTSSILAALGHSFYSLSLAMGIIMTFGSYIDKKEDMLSLSVNVTIADTVVALMAGMVIFPAVFAYGFKPDSGPSLIFITLPAVFESMPFGAFFETLFFILIAIAAITSTISLLEVVVTFLIEQFDISRKKSTLISSLAVFALSIPSTLSFSVMDGVTIFGMNFFDAFDFITSNIFLPVAGLLICIFVGWVYGTDNIVEEVRSEGTVPFKTAKIYSFIIKYIAPVGIFIIFLNSIGVIKF